MTTAPYIGRHRLPNTQPIALPPAAPMQHGRLSRPLRPVPVADPTTAIAMPRMYPPLEDRTGLTLTRRGHIALVAVGTPAFSLALYGFWSAVGAIGQWVGVQ